MGRDQGLLRRGGVLRRARRRVVRGGAGRAGAGRRPRALRGGRRGQSMVAMTDEESGPADRPAGGGRHARRPDVDHQHRRVHVEHGRRRAGWGSSGTRRRSERLERTIAHARGRWSATTSGQFYNWYDHRPGEKLTVWPPSGAAARAAPVVGRQRLAGRRPAGRAANTVPELADRAGRDLRLDALGPLLQRRPQPDPLPHRAADGPRARAATTRSSPRAGSRPTSASPRARSRRSTTSGRTAPSRTRATGPGRRRARSATRARTTAGRPTTARYAYNGHAGHAELGREHVRGAHAVALPARGGVGAGQLGREPPAHRRARRSTTGWRRPATATGASRRPRT